MEKEKVIKEDSLLAFLYSINGVSKKMLDIPKGFGLEIGGFTVFHMEVEGGGFVMIYSKIMRGLSRARLSESASFKAKDIIKILGYQKYIPPSQSKFYIIYGILGIYVVSSKAIGREEFNN